MKTRLLVLLSILFCLTVSPSSHAQIPRTLSYQGVLTDNAGKPRPDGSYNFTFRFYTLPTGGTAIWSESKSLLVKSGLFSTALGEQTSFGAAVKFDTQYWLGIQVGSDPELSPRIALTSVGYSFSSLRADTASVSVASLADTTWRHSGANIYRMNGNVGIGTATPRATFHVVNPAQQSESLLRIGSDAPGNTHLTISTSEFSSGYARLQAVKNEGAAVGDIILNPIGGNVGIGTTTPTATLQVVCLPQQNESLLRVGSDAPGNTHLTISTSEFRSGYARLQAVKNEGSAVGDIVLNPIGGNVGVGTTAPTATLQVVSLPQQNESVLRIGSNDPGNTHLSISTSAYRSGYARLQAVKNEGAAVGDIVLNPIGGNVGIGTVSPSAELEVVGTTTTKVLKITGGGDLAEPFEISESQPIPKGALVIIDEENPGRLKLSHQAYDKRVAGVVSGAGGINPGITLTQEGMLEGGQNVALSGRVYALATAANGPIKPGDLLTTAEVPGHAMKATDFVRWQGAVIGKAMSVLENGEGLVLVLVNLQ